MGDLEHPSIVRKPAVVLQRVTSSDQARRLVGAPVSQELLKRYGGVVGENHVVFLEQVNGKAVLSPRRFAQVLRSKPIDSLFRSLSGAANVSAFELQQLPLPEPSVLVSRLARDDQIDLAVIRAFRKSNPRK
jgi:adenine-specific DNA-methyltransferase